MSTSLFPRRDDFFAPFEQSLDNFFNEFFHSSRLASLKDNARFPKMDIVETDNQLQLKAVVAGWDEKDLNIEITPENVVVVSGEKKTEVVDGPVSRVQKYHIRELKQSSFRRAVQLPDYVQGDPQAVMKDGILTLSWQTVKDVPEEPKIKRIAIKTE
jgi:HSP20 family protein